MITVTSKLFDDLVKAFRDLAGPQLVLALVVDREGGVHFTIQGIEGALEELPGLLLTMADSIREDIRIQKPLRRH